MAAKRPFALKPYLYVLIHGHSGPPYALRLNVIKLSWFVVGAGLTFFATLSGTLLFFRELEVNRRLQDRILDIETRDKLAGLISGPPPEAMPAAPVAPLPLPLRPPAPAAITKSPADSAKKPEPNPAMPSSLLAAAQAAKTSPTDSKAMRSPDSAPSAAKPATPVVAKAVEMAGTRIADLSTDCSGETCEVKLSMMPISTGVAQGQLLMVLETEIPRIGAGNPTTQIRKRYFIYPGDVTRDELSQEALAELEAKPYRFSRALNTSAVFKVGKLLRPLAINVYLFDKDHTLNHHERKIIETEE